MSNNDLEKLLSQFDEDSFIVEDPSLAIKEKEEITMPSEVGIKSNIAGVTARPANGTETVQGEKKIVIIDDNDSILDIYSSICRKYFNVQVYTAENGTDGLELVNKFIPDLVLVDLTMPGDIGGFDLIRTLKSNPSLKHIPIIIISGAGSKGNVMLGLKTGARDFMVKPTPQSVIIEKIAKQLKVDPNFYF